MSVWIGVSDHEGGRLFRGHKKNYARPYESAQIATHQGRWPGAGKPCHFVETEIREPVATLGSVGIPEGHIECEGFG